MKIKNKNKIFFVSTLSALSLMLTGCFSEKVTSEQEVKDEKVVEVEEKVKINSNLDKNAKKAFKSGIEFKEGEHYRKVTDIKSSLEAPFIVEYFWLGCPHCQKFEPVLEEFLSKNPDVKIVKKHAASNQSWGKDAMLFNTMVIMGRADLSKDLLKLYEEKNPKYPTKQEIEEFLTSNNVDLEEFKRILETEPVLDMIEESLNEMNKNKITGVPSIVVNGKYTPIMQNPNLRRKDVYFELLRHLMDKK